MNSPRKPKSNDCSQTSRFQRELKANRSVFLAGKPLDPETPRYRHQSLVPDIDQRPRRVRASKSPPKNPGKTAVGGKSVNETSRKQAFKGKAGQKERSRSRRRGTKRIDRVSPAQKDREEDREQEEMKKSWEKRVPREAPVDTRSDPPSEEGTSERGNAGRIRG